MKLLALDLGTKTGWALYVGPGAIFSGAWDLKPSRFSGGGMRFVRFVGFLTELHKSVGYDRVVFEEVRRHMSTDAAHVYGGLMATLTMFCEDKGLPYEGVPVGTIKKSWTGKGNASKAEMVAEAKKRGFYPQSEDEADALAILHTVVGVQDV